MLKSLKAATAAVLLSTPVLAEPVTYAPDPGHTEVRFYWNHAGVAEQSGEWGRVTGEVTMNPENIEATTISIEVDPASVMTGVAALDKHMKAADMFDVEEYPAITFVSTSVERTGDRTARVTGDLTIKGNTLPITLDATVVHLGEHPLGQYMDVYKGQWMGVKVTGTLKRSEFGVGYGTPIVSDEIRLEILSELKETQADPGRAEADDDKSRM